MNSGRKLTIALIAALMLLSSTACLAIFPTPDFPPGYMNYSLKLGWYDNTQSWYVTFDASTNNINVAKSCTPNLWLSTKLSSALTPRVPGGDIAAQPVYIITNPDKAQGPVFAVAPDDPLYSGLWQIFYVTWKTGAIKRPITNANPSPDPNGLPSAADANIVATQIVVQYPIVALGPLGGCWYPGPVGTYRIPQALALPDYTYTKMICLPTYTVFCADFVTKRVCQRIVAITDASDQALADLLGANLAPGLLNMPDSDTQAFWSINASPYKCQFPILQACPLGSGPNQINPAWSPVVRLTYLDRTGLPQSTVVNNPTVLQALIGSGKLTLVSDDQRMGILFFNSASPLP